MGQHYLLQASVFRAAVLFAVVVSIPHVYSDCSLCQYKNDRTTSDITIFVGNDSSCSVQNTNITKTPNSIRVTELQPGNTYFFKINCSDVCCGNFSTNPEPVSNLSVNSITVSSVSLSWILLNGISPYYRVAWDVNLLTTNQTSMQISQLAPGTKYTFNVTSVASDNRTEGRTVQISQNTSPAQVENITLLNSTNSSLTLAWTPPLGHVDSYEVSVSGTELKTITVSTNSSVISNLTAGRVYNLTVTSISGVLKNISNIVQFATKPNPPEALSVSGQTNGSISLLWSKPLSMDGLNVTYEVLYRSSQSGVNLNLNPTTSLNMTLKNVLSGSQYDIAVVTIGVKDLRSSLVNLTAYTVPNTVQNLVVSAVSTSSVNLTWLPPNGNSNLFSYSVSISSPDQTLSTTSNNYQITQLQPGTLYNCSIRTLIVANISGPSQFIQCNTKPLPVTNLTTSPVGTTEMRLSWFYQRNNKSLYRYNVSVNGERWIQSSNETTQVSDLIPGNNYTFTVQAVVNGMISETVAISAFTGRFHTARVSGA